MIRPVRLKTVIAASIAVWMVMLSLGSAVVMADGYQGRPSTENSLGLQVKAAILIDADSGQVLYEVNSEEPLPAASMTKLMTEYIVLEEISNGRLNWDEVVTTSAEAASTPADGSSVFLAQGDQHTVLDLYRAMAVGSANDATIALASKISGSEQGFVTKMNEVADQLGLETAIFTSATGLSETTVISTAEMAKLAQIILNQHPEFLEYSKLQEYKFRERDKTAIVNINWMLGTNVNQSGLKHLAYEGVDGMKTGFINSAGYNFTGTVKRGEQRFISVVMDTATKSARFNETAKMYDYGFSTFEKKTVLAPKSVVETMQSVKIKKGKKKSLAVVTDKDITFMVKKGVEPKIEVQSTDIKPDSELIAPIAAGTVVGTVTYKYTDADTAQELTRTVNLITNEDGEKGGWFRLMFRGIGDFFAGLFNGIVNLF
ncbi:D-alanyl-D-alanine carboxypeptidase [Paenibacillus sp. FSL H8-0548]|uniref:D-alanyl-D-alanine carboxypeptidase family protein n=1 Tax=Paenibacillus sp. FSL H8-0548 TaxID=1920422 RepID=UPI00096FD0F4|nr:D-alanyl-D-alanine carboxypeptidase family protein [Paenibacillus sp. FSL H8-0548]OMF29118.1 D-alanyl-D-alanine carboxypeptidase [Paenibacillus sp. FSL H8-0548]